jgi:hypothetical protein
MQLLGRGRGVWDLGMALLSGFVRAGQLHGQIFASPQEAGPTFWLLGSNFILPPTCQPCEGMNNSSVGVCFHWKVLPRILNSGIRKQNFIQIIAPWSEF